MDQDHERASAQATQPGFARSSLVGLAAVLAGDDSRTGRSINFVPALASPCPWRHTADESCVYVSVDGNMRAASISWQGLCSEEKFIHMNHTMN